MNFCRIEIAVITMNTFCYHRLIKQWCRVVESGNKAVHALFPDCTMTISCFRTFYRIVFCHPYIFLIVIFLFLILVIIITNAWLCEMILLLYALHLITTTCSDGLASSGVLTFCTSPFTDMARHFLNNVLILQLNHARSLHRKLGTALLNRQFVNIAFIE